MTKLAGCTLVLLSVALMALALSVLEGLGWSLETAIGSLGMLGIPVGICIWGAWLLRWPGERR